MSFMFANSRPTQQQSGYLVEFKAGKSQLQPGSTPEKRKVVADKTKGTIFIKQTADQLMHFCWKNRETGAVVDDLIIFPGDTEFVQVKECPDGRVCMLKFKSSDRRCLFWFQDGAADKDEEYVRKVNDVLNNPPTPRSSGRSGANATERTPDLSSLLGGNGNDELGALSNLDQNQLMQLLTMMGHGGASALGLDQASVSSMLPQFGIGGSGGAASTPVTSATASATWTTPAQATATRQTTSSAAPGAIQLSQLQNIISSINVPSANVAIPLESIIGTDNVMEALRDGENAQRLLAHLPNEPPISPNRDELEQTMRAPQLRQATEAFGHALQTGQMGAVLQQFGVAQPVVEAANSGDLEKFAEKLTESESNTKKVGSSTGVTDTTKKTSDESSSAETTATTNERESETKSDKTDEMDLD